jgi:hypothetical protein
MSNQQKNISKNQIMPSEKEKIKPKEPPFKKILLTKEFLQLYFMNLGANPSLNVDNYTDTYDMLLKRNKEKFCFAIVKTKSSESYKSDYPSDKGLKDLELETFYPKNDSNIDDSLKFLLLTYSGFLNYDTKTLFDPNLIEGDSSQEKDKKRKIEIFEQFLIDIRRLSIQKRSQEKKDLTNNINKDGKKIINNFNLNNFFSNELYSFVLKKQGLIDIHNGFIYKLCQNRIDKLNSFTKDESTSSEINSTENTEINNNNKIQNSNNTEPEHHHHHIKYGYSLFIAKDNMIIEIDTLNKEVNILKRGASEKIAKEVILEHILSKNESKEKCYLDDITVFTEANNFEADKEERPNSEGITIILLASIVFVIIFFIINPQKIFYDLRSSFVNYFEINDNGLNSLDYDISNISDLSNYFNRILDKLYNKDLINYSYGKSIEVKSGSSSTSIGSSSTSSNNKKNIRGNSYYPLNSNFYSGMLLNFKRTQFSRKKDLNNNDIQVRKSDLTYYGTVPYDETEDFLSYNYNNKNALMPDSYSLYFKPNLNDIQLQWYRDQIEPIFDSKLYEFMYSILIYNMDHKCVILYSVKVTFNSFGEVTYNRFIQGFLPYLYIPNNIFFLIMSILYLLCFLYILFLIIRKTFHFKLSDFPFEWYYWLDIIVIAISFASQIISYSSFLFLNKEYSISIEYENDFTFWVNHSLSMRLFLRLTGLAIVLICFRLIRFLYTSFPNFGVVFQTLGYAYKEILAFMVIVVSILIGISMMTHVAFGSYSVAFRDINSSVVEIFLMFMGIFDYNNFYNSNYYNPIAPYFFVFFMVFMNLILINTFLCIIRNNYAEIKEKKQKFNEAYNLFLKDQSEELRSKVLNLVLFRDPQSVSENDKEKGKEIDVLFDNNKLDKNELNMSINKNKINSDTNTDDKEANNNNINNGTSYAVSKSNNSMWSIFLINIKNLDLKTMIFGDEEENQKFEQIKFNKFKEIDRLNFLDHLDEIEVNYEKEYNDLTDTLCYVGFILVFVIMLYLQFSIGIRSELEQYVTDFWKTQRFNFLNSNDNTNNNIISEVNTWKKVEQSIDRLIINSYSLKKNFTCGNNSNEENSCNSPSAQGSLINQRLENYILLQAPHYRIRLRFFEYQPNDNLLVNEKVFIPYILKDISSLEDDYCYSSSELIDDFNIQNDNLNFKFLNKLFPSTDPSSVNCGGFVYYFNNTQPYCNENPPQNSYCKIKKVLFSDDYSLGSIYLDNVLASLHYNFIIYTKLSYIRGSMGLVETNINSYSIPINQYNNAQDFNRLIVEIMYIIYIFYYLYLKLNAILNILSDDLHQDYINDPNNENFTKSNYLNKFLRINFKEYENESIFKTIFSILFIIIKKIIILTFFIISAICKFIFSDFFNLIDIVSLVISIWLIINWYQLVFYSYHLNFNFIEGESDITKMNYTDYNNNIYIAAQMADKLSIYTLWASINAFFILIRMIQYYKFSKPIYLLICIISKAKSTISFHLIFIAIVNLGFMIFGYSLFSHNIKDYSTLGNTLLQLIIILAGKVNYSDHAKIDQEWAGLFIIFFTMMNTLVLFNVLNAIIIISYREIKLTYKSSTNDLSFYENIKNIIYNNFVINIQTSNLLYNNLTYLKHEIRKECDLVIDSNLEELDKDSSGGKVNIGYCEIISKKNDLRNKYLVDVSKRIDKVFRTTLKNKLYNNNIINDNEKNLNINFSKQDGLNKNNVYVNNKDGDRKEKMHAENKITSLGYFSISTKMMLFVWNLISEDLSNEEKNIKHIFIPEKLYNKNNVNSSDNVNSENNNNNKDSNLNQNNNYGNDNISNNSNNEKNRGKNRNNDNDSVNNENDAFEFSDNNLWLDNFKKTFRYNFDSKGRTFLKENLFDTDIKNLSLSKEVASNNKMVNFSSIYQIEPINREHFYNLNFDPPCPNCLNINSNNSSCKSPVNVNKDDNLYDEGSQLNNNDYNRNNDLRLNIINNCKTCNLFMSEYERLYLLIYNTIFKYFYLPKEMTDYDKEIYYGYYLNEFLKHNKNKIEYLNFIKTITSQKVDLFNEEILKIDIMNLDKNNFIEKDNDKKEENENVLNNPEFRNIVQIITNNTNLISSENNISSLENINKLLKNSHEKSEEAEIMLLSKYFVIWNALYVIFFKKYSDFVSRLKERSVPNMLLEYYNNYDLKSGEYSTFYSFYFIQNFKLNEKMSVCNSTFKPKIHDKLNNTNINNLSHGGNETNLNNHNNNEITHLTNNHKNKVHDKEEDVIKTKTKLEIIKSTLKQAVVEDLSIDKKLANTAIDLFYKDSNIYLFEESEENLMKKITPPDLENNINNIQTGEYYPDILKKLWEKLSKNSKFDMFYGYNSFVKKGALIDWFLDPEIFDSGKDNRNKEYSSPNKKESNTTKYDINNKNKIDCGIYEFFTSPHRGEVLKSINFPNSFTISLKNELKIFNEDFNVIDINKLNDVYHIKAILKLLCEVKLNYLKYYEFLNIVFKKYLSKPKSLVSQIKSKYKDVFKVFNNINSNLFDNTESKITFVNFYKLLLCKSKYEQLYSYFERYNKEDKYYSKVDNMNDYDDSINMDQDEVLNRYKEGNKLNNNEEINFNKKKEKEDEEFMLNERRIFNEYEVFIIFFSLGPIELIVRLIFILIFI